MTTRSATNIAYTPPCISIAGQVVQPHFARQGFAAIETPPEITGT